MSLPVPPRPDVGGGPQSDVTGRSSERSGPDVGGARPRTTWGPLEGIGVWLVANLLIGGILVYSLFAAVLELDDVDGGADADVLLASAAIALVTAAILWLWLRSRHPTWRAAMGLEGDGLGLRHRQHGLARDR